MPQLLLTSIGELVAMKDWDWDYVLNLSESDYPVKNSQALRDYLTANMGANFVKSHGHDQLAFVMNQGIDKAFVECEQRMWRLGPRKMQRGIQVGTIYAKIVHMLTCHESSRTYL